MCFGVLSVDSGRFEGHDDDGSVLGGVRGEMVEVKLACPMDICA